MLFLKNIYIDVPLFLAGFSKNVPLLVFVLLLGLLYRQLQPPVPKICGTPGGPPVTGPRLQLKDGRHLAYHEYGVPKDQAKHKIIFVHGFDSCRYDALQVSPVSRDRSITEHTVI